MCNRILVKGTDVDDLSVSPKIRQLMQVINYPALDFCFFGSWSLETFMMAAERSVYGMLATVGAASAKMCHEVMLASYCYFCMMVRFSLPRAFEAVRACSYSAVKQILDLLR